MKPPPAKTADFWLVFLNIGFDPQGVFYGSECKEFVDICTRKFGLGWLGTRRKDELVIGFLQILLLFPDSLQILHDVPDAGRLTS